MNKSVFAIVLAGGSGTRFGGQTKKQFIAFHGKELWRYIYDTLCRVLPEENIVVVGVDIPGGETRNGSVKNGLEWIQSRSVCKRVIICEAARPLVTESQIERIIKEDAPSSCFVNPVVDTIILKDKTYVNRADCMHLVSPQAFDFDLLFKAYDDCDLAEIRTDETRLMNDVYGIKPVLLTGGENLYKVTYPKDIAVLELIYQNLK